jgi:hypothetical protein
MLAGFSLLSLSACGGCFLRRSACFLRLQLEGVAQDHLNEGWLNAFYALDAHCGRIQRIKFCVKPAIMKEACARGKLPPQKSKNKVVWVFAQFMGAICAQLASKS